MEHVSGIVGLLHDPPALSCAEFAVGDDEVDALGENTVSEDFVADFAARSVHHLAGWRQRRNLGLIRGWFKRLRLTLTARALEVANEFKMDYVIFKSLKNIENKSNKSPVGIRERPF